MSETIFVMWNERKVWEKKAGIKEYKKT